MSKINMFYNKLNKFFFYIVLIYISVLTGPIKANEEVTVATGYSNFGELKYSLDFDHLDYVNPDAPKGGEISIWARGTFDSMNPY